MNFLQGFFRRTSTPALSAETEKAISIIADNSNRLAELSEKTEKATSLITSSSNKLAALIERTEKSTSIIANSSNKLATLSERTEKSTSIIANSSNKLVALSEGTEKSISIIADNSDRLAAISDSFGRAALLPLPVQTFPTTDNFRWEKEKFEAADLAKYIFNDYELNFTKTLGAASDGVLKETDVFFKSVQLAAEESGGKRSEHLCTALKSLLPCSPKKISAEFQKQALIAGWAYVNEYNRVIDKLAETYPRCRSGIYMSRLKYSDVIQIAEEILTTLRACSTLMDDLQRRYDILEALQNGIQADLETPESDKIWAAMKETVKDPMAFGKKDSGATWLFKKISALIIAEPVTLAGTLIAAPTLQIQGQMQREQRILFFFSTVKMFQDGWKEWENASKDIIKPNLKIMFELKRDFFRNQVLCLCDLITYNGYSLDGLPKKLLALYK